MASQVARNDLAIALCDALGLENVTRMQLNLTPAGNELIATVFVPTDGLLVEVVKRFHLSAHPIDEDQAS